VGTLGTARDGGTSTQRFAALGDAGWRRLAGTAEGHALVYEGMLAYQLGDKAGSSSGSGGGNSSSSGKGGGSSGSSSGGSGSVFRRASSSSHDRNLRESFDGGGGSSGSVGSGGVHVRATLRRHLEEALEPFASAAAALYRSGGGDGGGGNGNGSAGFADRSVAVVGAEAMPAGRAVLNLSQCFGDPRPPPPSDAAPRPAADPVAALGWWDSGGSSSSSSGNSGNSGSSSSGGGARAHPPPAWPPLAPSPAEAGALAAMLLHAAEFGAVVSDGVALDSNGFAGLWATAALSEGAFFFCACQH
jgi:hypothetical protein